MDAQRIAVDAIVVLTGCDRDEVADFIRRLYLSGVKDPKRLTFKGLQAVRWRTRIAPIVHARRTVEARGMRQPWAHRRCVAARVEFDTPEVSQDAATYALQRSRAPRRREAPLRIRIADKPGEDAERVSVSCRKLDLRIPRADTLRASSVAATRVDRTLRRDEAQAFADPELAET